MSNRCSLETQTKKVNMIIDFPFHNSIDYVCNTLSKMGYLYALILHDKDINNNGELKVKHYHLILSSPKRHRLKYYLTNISEIFDKFELVNGLEIPSLNGVEVMTSESFEWDLQYLIHKNNPDKFQYSFKDIITNIPSDSLNEMLSLEVHKEISVQQVLDIVCNSSSRTEIAVKLGVGYFNLYRNIIEIAIKDDNLLGSKLSRKDLPF